MQKYIRIIVTRWTSDQIHGRSSAGLEVTVPVSPDFSYILKLLREGSQLNVIGALDAPELMVYEPDALMDISSIANCIESYGSLPYNYLLSQIRPPANTSAILMGNLAGQLLDEQIHAESDERSVEESYTDSIQTFFRRNAVQLVTCPDLARDFHRQAKLQAEHIRRIIRQEMPRKVKSFDRTLVLLEPSFFSEMLGLQGRMDMLQLDYKVLVEQKAGQGAYPPGADSDTPRQQPKHYVQMLLYMALLHYNFGISFSDIQGFLLYSKYANGLLSLGASRPLLLDAMRVRNQVVWCEQWYADGGSTFLDQLQVEQLNRNHATDIIWSNRANELKGLLKVLHRASPTERAYYHRLITFLHAEQWIGKVGSPLNPEVGGATKWKLSLEEKLQAGCIYHKLTLREPDADHEGIVRELVLSLPEGWESDTTNFRLGDAVIVYPYPRGEVPDARQTMVQRGSLHKVDNRQIVIRLRAQQNDARVFRHTHRDCYWAIEHDAIDSTFNSLYRNLHGFLSAPRERRDLLLLQHSPEVDASLALKGQYGAFNELVLRAKQAREMFLVIGPPGTGKTSFGLMNILKEQRLSTPSSRILLMSYTNRAIDEICSKLVEEELDFLRLGSEATSAEPYHPYLLENRAQQCSNLKEVKQLLDTQHIFVGTTTALNGLTALFSIVQFDLAIIDEASQILEPHIVPLLANPTAIRKFVLIGDHKQLPAVVQQSTEASHVSHPLLQAIGLTDCRNSFFQRMLDKYRQDATVCYLLRNQGRMHPLIAKFPNETFYGGQLGIAGLPHQLEESVSPRVRFVNVPTTKESISDKVNLPEAQCIAEIVGKILKQFKAKEIGVIVPYRNQIAAIRSALQQLELPDVDDFTIDTVERYQGSQREVILYGFTVQKPYQLDFLSQGNFVEDGVEIDRKLNVAMTRARRYLYLIGNASLLRQNDVFRRMLDFLSTPDEKVKREHLHP